jgi:hypothetical protein
MRWLKIAPQFLEFAALLLLFSGIVSANSQLRPFEKINQDRSGEVKLNLMWEALKQPTTDERIQFTMKNNEKFYELGNPSTVEYFEDLANKITFASMLAAFLYLISKVLTILTHLLTGYYDKKKEGQPDTDINHDKNPTNETCC